MALPRGVMALSAVCDCGISGSYSLTIFNIEARSETKLIAPIFHLIKTDQTAHGPMNEFQLFVHQGRMHRQR